MIAVSEPPMEFIPRGRSTVEDHPGPSTQNESKDFPSEHLLLHRLANVNISSSVEEHQEFWCVREMYDDSVARIKRKKQKSMIVDMQRTSYDKRINVQYLNHNVALLHEQRRQDDRPSNDTSAIFNNIINNEEELYVNKCTVVWSQGIQEDETVLKQICFTCETPVKFAFFVTREFVRGRLAQVEATLKKEDKLASICIIDQETMRVYCNNGDDYRMNLEFPISHVWPTKHGLLLEKNSGHAVVQSLTVPMPRLFSLSHPQDEMCPVLFKTSINSFGYMTEQDYHIVFSEEQTDLVLLYDRKISKHFISRLRKVTPGEVQNFVISQNDSHLSQTLNRGSFSNTQSFANSPITKNAGATPKNSSFIDRYGIGASNYSMNHNRFANQSAYYTNVFGSLNRTSADIHLSNLQSTIGYQSISMQDMRKVPRVKPAKPIEPVLCLEHLWTENSFGPQREFSEKAARSFLHTDLVGQTYLCYLLQRACRLHLVNIIGLETSEVQFSAMVSCTIPAKDAICLKRMQMIAILDPAGGVTMYTGAVLISKVHLTPGMIPATIVNLNATTVSVDGIQLNTSFPSCEDLTAEKYIHHIK